MTSKTALRIRERWERASGAPLAPTQFMAPFPAATHTNTRTSTASFPLDSRRELLPERRKEIVKKHRFLRNATGLMRALCEKPVQFGLPGGLTPSSDTGDRDFDAASDRYFDRWAMKPVSVDGEYTFYESQEMIGTEMPCDGDIYALKVRSSFGSCQLQFIQSHQIGDHPAARDGDKARFVDGIRRNSLNRAIAYRVLQDGIGFGSTTFRDYSREDILPIFDPLRFGLNRKLPWGYHGANSALDILDFTSLEKVAGKLNLALAAVLKRTGAKPGTLGPPVDLQSMFGGSPGEGGQAGGNTASSGGNGQVSWEAILGGGAIPVLEEGQELQFLDTKRLNGGFIPTADFLIRDIAAGWGVTYEFIWNMAAMGGPGARFILEDLNAFIARLQRILTGRYCHPTRSWVIANGIVRGELPECRTENWWECNWKGPQRVTVDRGRDGNLFVKLLEKGMITLDEWWSMLGKDSRSMRRSRIDEIAEDMAYCKEKGIPYAAYIASTPGSLVQATEPIAPDVNIPGSFSQDPVLDQAIRNVLKKGATDENIEALHNLVSEIAMDERLRANLQ